MTLDSDVYKRLRTLTKGEHQPAKKILNDLLRSSLAGRPARRKRGAFRLVTSKSRGGLMPGFSWEMSTSQMLDGLDEEVWRKTR